MEHREYIRSRVFGWGWPAQVAVYNSPGHYIDGRDRVCLKCNHTLTELLDASRYIPCLDEIPPVEEIQPPKTLEEREVEALESIAQTLKHKDFSTDTAGVLREAKEFAAGLFRGCKRK